MAGVKGRSGKRPGKVPKLSRWPIFTAETIERIRGHINATALVNRLQDHVNGRIEMQPTQVTVAVNLLRKVLPDLSAVDLTTSGDHSITVNLVQFDKETLKALPNTRPLLDVTPDTTAVDHDED
jgi:hypothetical protein